MGRKFTFDDPKIGGESDEKSLIRALRDAADALKHQRQIGKEDLFEVRHGRTRVRMLGSLTTAGVVAVLCFDLLLRAWRPGYSSPAWMPGALAILAITSLIIALKK
jgi:hypothetical protein